MDSDIHELITVKQYYQLLTFVLSFSVKYKKYFIVLHWKKISHQQKKYLYERIKMFNDEITP